MIRILGVTFDHTTNYGSNLQALALQTVIRSSKACGEECTYDILPLRLMKDFPWPPRKTLKQRVAGVLVDLHRKQFDSFDADYMHYAPVTESDELGRLNDLYDGFVCGSDVVWNPTFNRHMDVYFLTFAKKHCFSYAASFSNQDFTDEEKKWTGTGLRHLDDISVREEQGVAFVRELSGRDAVHVLDPVLLMDREQWKQFLPAKSMKKPYIFVYVTHLNSHIQETIRILQKKTGYKVVISAWGPKQALKMGMLQVHKPMQWLELLSNAEYVVTNSFHATAFAVLFGRKFFTVVYGKKDEGINIRMYDFLHTLGLENRILASGDTAADFDEIDYTKAYSILAEERKKSYAYLQKNLDAVYRQKYNKEEE